MAMGIPVVATPEAAKGTQAFPGEHLLVAADPDTFANHVVRLIQSEELRRRISTAARNNLEKVHMWPASMELLDGLLPQPVEVSQVT
jgi:hypothetical protein